MYCEKCDTLFDTDYDIDCPHCEEEIEVAPGVYQSREDFDANMAYDEARDNQL